MKFNRKLSSVVYIISFGLMINVGTSFVHAATNDEAVYPPLTSAEDAPDDAGASSQVNDKVEYPKLNKPEEVPNEGNNQAVSTKVSKPQISRSNQNVTYSNVETSQPAPTTTTSQGKSNSSKNISQTVQKAEKPKAETKKYKSGRKHKKINKKAQNEHKNIYVKSKDMIFGTTIILAIGIFTYLIRKKV